MAQETQQKWQGKATTKLPNSTADQIWPLLSNFFAIHKWFPLIDTCTYVEGSSPRGQPGCIRYCAGNGVSSPDQPNGQERIISWTNEKLLSIDPSNKCFTYEVLDNNIGFKSYVATMKVLENENENEKKGCELEWAFVADPVQGWNLEDLVFYVESNLDLMGKRMEEVVFQQTLSE